VKILVLKPGCMNVEYAQFVGGEHEPSTTGVIKDYRGVDDGKQALSELRQEMSEAEPYALAVRVIFGGESFRGPAVADTQVVRQIEAMIPRAPLHLPHAVQLIRDCEQVFPEIPAVVVFETSFFVDLPPHEFVYALEPEVRKALGVRRYGYHGILHEAACEQSARSRRRSGATSTARILSICLEPQPEVAAVLGNRPLMVSSGATPLEGIPGHRKCGAIDPSIVVTLAQKMGWGPELINTVLTEESGLLALCGEATSLGELFKTQNPDLRLAREVIRYRILLACGAGMAALGGVDAIVFSGRFFAAGETLGPWLKKRLSLSNRDGANEISTVFFQDSLERVIADAGAAALRASGRACGARV